MASTRTLKSPCPNPGLGKILGTRALTEFGDDPTRYATANARKNYPGTSPTTRQSGKKKTVLARHVPQDRLVDALSAQAFAALCASPDARAYYDQLHTRGAGHAGALRQPANRLVGTLHGCLTSRGLYDETTAWPYSLTSTRRLTSKRRGMSFFARLCASPSMRE